MSNSYIFKKLLYKVTVKNKFKNLSFSTAFLCGPEKMIHIAKETLIQYGLDKNNIHFELFSTPVSSENEPTQTFEGTSKITILLDDEETTFEMDTKTTILTAALKEENLFGQKQQSLLILMFLKNQS